MKVLFLQGLFLFFYSWVFAQELPILNANSPVLSIQDGETLLENYWTVSPKIPLDIYTADKTNTSKVVSFYSDIDSLSFPLKPYEALDFMVLLNGKDTCMQRLESGIQSQQVIAGPITQDTIPFTLTPYNNIAVQTILNQEDTLSLMFHLASSSVFLTQEATQRISSLNLSQVDTAGSWGGGGITRYSSNDNQIQIGDLHFDEITVMEDKHSGKLTDGKFGPDLFEDKIIELDFDQQIMIIHSKLPATTPSYNKHDIVFKRGTMFIEGQLGVGPKRFPNLFMLHTGFSGTLLLGGQFAHDHRIGDQLPVLSKSRLLDAFGNELITNKIQLPLLNLGSFSFQEVPAAFFEGTIGMQRMSVIGADLLKRFNMIIDLQNAYIYLKGNGLANSPFSSTS